jgi:heme A synthase
MGARAEKTADIRAAAAAAVLSTIATIIQMGLGVTCIPTLRMLAIRLIFAGVAAVLLELPLWLARFGRRQKAIHKVAEPSACQQL